MDRVSLKSQNAQFGFCSRGGSRILERVRFEEITASVKREPIMGSGGFAFLFNTNLPPILAGPWAGQGVRGFAL